MKRSQAGFGLVELMISITLGLLLSAAVIQVYLASSTTSRVQDSLAQIQENARFALSFMGREIRVAGHMGCNSLLKLPLDDPNNLATNKTINTVALPDPDFDETTMVVGDDNVDAGNALGAVAGTDTIMIQRASDDFIRITGNLPASNTQISVEDNSIDLVQGDFAMVTDCTDADIFRVSNAPDAAGEGQTALVHGTAGGVNGSASLSKIYTGDAEIFGFETLNFFVRDTGRDNSAGEAINALYFTRRQAGSGGVTSAATELVEGVESLQITYGVDTDNDHSINVYQTAADVADWTFVQSVKVEMIMVGNTPNVVGQDGDVDAQVVVDTGGNSIANNDGRMRAVFTNVFTLRNKVQ